MTPEEKRAWAEDLLRRKCRELGRLPTKKDFDSATCAQIKAYLGPWPRALESAALMYNFQTVNWEILKSYYISGLTMDLIHAAATVIFILIAAEPMLEKLDRIKVKSGLVE